MAKSIILTQNDSGIELNVQFLDDKKDPVYIVGSSIEIQFITPSDVLMPVEYGQITDGVNGEVSFVLGEEHTAEEGLYKTYWKVIDANSEITAQSEVYYYVKALYGGVGGES